MELIKNSAKNEISIAKIYKKTIYNHFSLQISSENQWKSKKLVLGKGSLEGGGGERSQNSILKSPLI
jgi:hypothetical protein